MHALAKVDSVPRQYLPNPEAVRSAGTLDEATDVVSRNIYPHKLRVADMDGRH